MLNIFDVFTYNKNSSEVMIHFDIYFDSVYPLKESIFSKKGSMLYVRCRS